MAIPRHHIPVGRFLEMKADDLDDVRMIEARKKANLPLKSSNPVVVNAIEQLFLGKDATIFLAGAEPYLAESA
jgi:hypothetical protein